MDITVSIRKAVPIIAWVLTQPGDEPAELAHFFRLVSSDPWNINRWVEALSRIQQYAQDHNGPTLTIDEYMAAVGWLSAAAGRDRLLDAKQAVYQEVKQFAPLP